MAKTLQEIATLPLKVSPEESPIYSGTTQLGLPSNVSQVATTIYFPQSFTATPQAFANISTWAQSPKLVARATPNPSGMTIAVMTSDGSNFAGNIIELDWLAIGTKT